MPTSSAPSAAKVGRQPEWRPDGLIGSPPSSGSFTRVADVPSVESVQVTSRMSVGVPASAWVWQVTNFRDIAKSG